MGRWLADQASNAAARTSADNVFGIVGSTAPSTTERRYSSTVIPLACACAKSPASSSGLTYRKNKNPFRPGCVGETDGRSLCEAVGRRSDIGWLSESDGRSRWWGGEMGLAQGRTQLLNGLSAFSVHLATARHTESPVVAAVLLGARTQPTYPAHRLTAAIDKGIHSKVPSQRKRPTQSSRTRVSLLSQQCKHSGRGPCS